MSTGFGAFLVIYGSQLLVQMERITTSAPKTLEILIVFCRGFLILKKYQWCFYDEFDDDDWCSTGKAKRSIFDHFLFFTLILFTTLRSSTHNICRVPCIKYPPLDRNLIIPWSFHPCSCTQFVSVSQEPRVSLCRWGRIRTVILGKSVVYRCHVLFDWWSVKSRYRS